MLKVTKHVGKEVKQFDLFDTSLILLNIILYLIANYIIQFPKLPFEYCDFSYLGGTKHEK